MALTSSINNAIFNQLNTVWGTGEIVGEVIPTQVRTASNNATPFKITGLALYLSGRNSAVSTAIGVETSTSPFFQTQQGTIPVETGIKPISYTFSTSPQKFNVIVYANGSTNVGTNNYDGLAIQVAGVTIPNKTLVGRYEYIQVPAAPTITGIDLITSSSMRVSFSPSEDAGGGTLAGYQLQVASSSNFSSGLRVFNITETSHTVTNLDSTKTYYVRVLAKNELWTEAQSAGSPWSSVEAATTRQGRSAASSSAGEAFFRYTEPSASNLYSEKVFAEHPLSLWSLDDKSDYISLISESNRNLAIWEADGGAAQANSLLPAVNVFTNPSFESSDGTIELTRNIINNPSFESNSGSQEIWKNLCLNPTFSEGTLLTTFSQIRKNYMLNPNFETNATNWTGTPAVTRQTSQIWSGTASGQVVWTAQNQYITGVSSVYLFEDAVINTATVSIYVKMTSGKTARLGVQYSTKFGTFDAPETKSFTGTGNWERVDLTVTAPTSTPYTEYFDGSVSIKLTNTSTGTHTVYIDGAMAMYGRALLPYFDGNGFGAGSSDADQTTAWVGTANASESILRGRNIPYVYNPNPGDTPGGGADATGYLSSQWGLPTSGGDGSKSLRISPNGESSESYVGFTIPPLKPSTTYTILGTVRLTEAQVRPNEFARKFRVLSYTELGIVDTALTYLSEAPNAAGVYLVRATFETTSINTADTLYLYNGDDTADVWWDNIALVEGVYLGGYFDGRTSPDTDLIPTFETVPASTRVNLIPNASFEIDLSGWTITNATAVRTSDDKYISSASMQVTGTSTASVYTNSLATTAGTHTVSAWVKGEANKKLRIGLRDSTGPITLSDPFSMTGSWQRIYFTHPITSTSVTVFINNGSTLSTHNFYVDGVLLEKSSTVNNFFDGSTTDTSIITYNWNGTPYNSASTASIAAQQYSRLSGLTPAGQVFTLENAKVLLSSSWSSSGTKSLKLISTSDQAPGRYYTTLSNLGLEVGKTYTAVIKTRLDQPQTGTLFNFPTIDSKFTFEQFDNIAGVQEGRITFTIDGTDVTLDDELSLYNRATVGNGDVWWDDFLVIEGTYTGDYFDGSSISSSPDITISWEGTPNISASIQSVSKPLGITNGYQTTEWSMLGEYSLRIPEEQTETITIAEESTITITARNIGQTITTNLGVYTTTTTEEEITLYEVTSLILGPGDWDNLCIVAGTFSFGYFDGSNPIQAYYSTSWSGVDNASTSIAQPLVTSIVSIGVTEPFADSATSVVIASDGSSSVRVVSPVFATWLDVNDYMSSLSIGMFVASDNSNLSSIDLGFTDGDNDYLQTFEFTVPGQWSFVSSQFAEMPANKEYQIVAVFNLIDPLTETKILVNGITAGQWGEEYQLTSLGATKVELPAEIGVSEFFGVEAKAYGLQGNDGYYLINDNLLLARNIGMPMVYGANNITSLFPNPDNGPSLVLPGNGFLNDLGRYRDYTIEFWCRINSGASEPRRIFGPLHSTDGIYVDGPFITLKIGEYVGSHYISEWYRPMLIDLVYGKNIIRLMVDGEIVVSIPIVASSLVLPAGTQDGINQDWLGFYAYDDVPQVELDSFSIYSYQVPQLVAKRRFVYGQGVEFPETMNVSFNGKSVLVDHTFADYTNSYRYPDIGRWIQGTSENVSIRNNVLSTPEYALPQVVFNKQSTASWHEDLSAIGDDLIDTITMKPNDSWADTEGYLLFESLNIVKQDIKAFYGVFQVDGSQINDEVLFKVEDDATKNYLLITISGNLFDGYDIKYTIRFGANAAPEVLLVDHVTTTNETIYAGIDIDRFARKYGRNLSSFFGSPRRLKVYAVGTKEFDKTFSGKISRIGFSTRRNFAKIASLFSVNGIIVPEVYDAGDSYFGNDPLAWDDTVDGGRPDTIFFESSLKNHVASYTLFAKKYYDNFKLDIATDSYWEDYIPLTYLGKEVLDDNGDMTYGLDFIQFNIDYPRPIAKLNGFYDTSESLVKTYISFQYITTGANQPAAAFDAIIPAPTNGVIDPSTMLDPGASWLNKKFEIVNNTIIYPPEGIDFKKLALVIHLEFETRGILSKSVKIKNLQISSKALNANQPNKIGTRLGQPVYPYTKYGIYFDYKAKNPYALYRGSTPYLYLTKDSGVKLAGDIDTTFNRGLSVTVNADRASRYRLTAIQAATLFPNDEFPTIPTPVFELDASTGTISFLIVSSHPNKKRGTIYAIDKATGRAFSDALFFLNGRFVKNPTISLNEWNMLSVAFMNNIALDGKAGAIRINGPMLFNNFSFYEETALQQARQASLRQWFGVRYSGDDDLLWDYWTPYSWEDALVLSPNDYDGVNPVELYSTYSGTNKIVVGDDTTLRIDSYKYKVYQDIVSTQYTITPL